jgi:opacity protein-like surface antigen
MSRSWSPGGLPAAALALTASLALAPAAGAQSGGAGFLFRRPVATLTLRGGVDRALGNSDVFDFSKERLTLGSNAFTGVSVGADLGIVLSDRFDLVLGVAHSRTSARSEFRRFVDQDDQPIEQTTGLARTPIGASVRAYLVPRGREIGRFAWVPRRVAPYVGAGGGTMYYRFTQAGDFVDEESLDVFDAELRSSQWTVTAHGLAGVDFSLSPRVALNTEARYNWARANMSQDFSNFDRIDLSGLVATAGLTLRF